MKAYLLSLALLAPPLVWAESAPPAEPPEHISLRKSTKASTAHVTALRAWQALNDGKINDAETAYRQLLASDPGNIDALHGLAAIAQQRGQLTTARNLYRRILELSPMDVLAEIQLGGKDSARENRLLQLLEEDDGPASQLALGHLYGEQQRWGDAEQAFAAALRKAPNCLICRYNRAVSLDHLGRNAEALEEYRLALAALPASPASFDGATVLKRLKRLGQ